MENKNVNTYKIGVIVLFKKVIIEKINKFKTKKYIIVKQKHFSRTQFKI